MIEAGTYLLLAPLTNGDISVKYERFDELSSLTSLLRDAGVTVIENGGYIRVFGAPAAPIFVRTAPYPDFPTDLQPQMAPLMAKYHGGEIEETVWQGRFGYLSSLAAFGLASSSSGSRAVVYPSRLHNGIAEASDLRGGAAALMCALSAGGVSRIKSPEIIMRGYEKIEQKLASVGACVIIK
jgi:UDP-N-acetylglucosamine 1-carboxyvinyltransferase